MGQQEARGKVKKIQGRMKESVGIMTGNRKLEREGSRQRAGGAVQEALARPVGRSASSSTGLAKAIKK